jgi:hypothetical protein
MLISEAAPPGVEANLPRAFHAGFSGAWYAREPKKLSRCCARRHAEAINALRLASKEGATASGGSVHGPNRDKRPEGAK